MMVKEKDKTKNVPYESVLMDKILKVRYTDLEEEKALCKQLLDISESGQYFYGSAFANVYLVDSHLALGEYSSCSFYLLRASFLCKEYGFDDLMLVICNLGGLYYQKLSDSQTALSYFLEGEKIAIKLGDTTTISKIYNNIGYLFSCEGELQTARTYFEKAVEVLESDLEGDNIRIIVSCLNNLSEAANFLGDAQTARYALERSEALGEDDIFSYIGLCCSWVSYHIVVGEFDKSKEMVDKIIKLFDQIEDHFFVCDKVEGLCGNMLAIGDKERTTKLLDIIENMSYDTSIFLQNRILGLKMDYWEAFGETDKLKQAYKEYYKIISQIAAVEDETRTQSIISKMQINQAKIDRETMLLQRKELENVSQLDELTGLYNRRYFNKLVTKMSFEKDVKRLGFIMLDVDYFKQFNDYYGHFKGDDALKIVAKTLADNAVEGIFVSRYGGDEFVCLCVNIKDEDVELYTKNVISDMKKARVLHEKSKSSEYLSVSLGYCNEDFADNMDVDAFLNLADQALYMAKEKERGTCERKRF